LNPGLWTLDLVYSAMFQKERKAAKLMQMSDPKIGSFCASDCVPHGRSCKMLFEKRAVRMSWALPSVLFLWPPNSISNPGQLVHRLSAKTASTCPDAWHLVSTQQNVY
jgi:hypothetical protein